MPPVISMPSSGNRFHLLLETPESYLPGRDETVAGESGGGRSIAVCQRGNERFAGAFEGFGQRVVARGLEVGGDE